MKFQWNNWNHLQTKVLAAVSSTFLVLFLGQFSVASFIIMRGHTELEFEEAKTDAERIERSFERELENLSTLIRDWAVWDDTYEFIKNRSPEYVESNLTPDTFTSLSLNVIAIFDGEGRLVYGAMFDPETDDVSDIAPSLVTALQQYPRLLNRTMSEPSLTGFAQIDDIPMILASYAILTSDGEGPVLGSFVIGQYFDSRQLASLSETTRLSVDSFFYGMGSLPKDIQEIFPTLIENEAGLGVEILSPVQIASYTLINDLQEQPAIILKATSDRNIYARGHLSLEYYFWSSLLIGLLFCLFILLLLRYLVLSRLEMLSQQVTCIDAIDASPVRINIPGNDELAQLAHTIDWTLLQLYQRTAELQVATQTAEAARKTADDANQAKNIFLANMSHELRTPLNAILGFAQVLGRDSTLSPHQWNQLSIINRCGEHLLSLIKDVLDMSKIEANHVDLNLSAFDLLYLLETLRDMLHLKAQAKGLELMVHCAADVPRYICSDSRKLRQTLINLLSNAIKFTDQGYVKLTVKILNQEHDGAATDRETPLVHLQFSVQDTGIGIDPDEYPLLFQPFVQTEAGRQSHQGTGLGLAISHKFVELLGGEITVDSALRQGSTFTFDIWANVAMGDPMNHLDSEQRMRVTQLHEDVAISPLEPKQKGDRPVHRILATMPSDWLKQLRQAAILLKDQDIFVLMEQIPEENYALKQLLREKVDNFDFDHIVALIDALSTPSAHIY